MRFANSSRAESIMRAGISSQPISMSKSGMRTLSVLIRQLAAAELKALDSSLHSVIPRWLRWIQRTAGLGSSLANRCLLLIQICLRNSYGQRPNASDDSNALRYRDGAPRVQNVKQVRALQTEIERPQHRISAQRLRISFISCLFLH